MTESPDLPENTMRRTRYEAEDDYEEEWAAEKRRRAWLRQRRLTHIGIVVIAAGTMVGLGVVVPLLAWYINTYHP